MIKSQARHVKHQTPIKPNTKNTTRQQNLSGKQNLHLSPCISGRYQGHPSICHSNDNICQQHIEGQSTLDVNIQQFECSREENKKLKVIQNNADTNKSQHHKRNKTQGNQKPTNQYGKMKKTHNQNKPQPPQLTIRIPPDELLRKNITSNIKCNIITQQDKQSTQIHTTIIPQYHFNKDKDNYEKRQIKSRKFNEKKAGLKIQQKNIDVLNKQIHSLLNFFKQGKNNQIVNSEDYPQKYEQQPPTPHLYRHNPENFQIQRQNSSMIFKCLSKKYAIPFQNQLMFKQQLDLISYRNNNKQQIDMLQQSSFFNQLNSNQSIKQQSQIQQNHFHNYSYKQNPYKQNPYKQNPNKQQATFNHIDNKIHKIKQQILLSEQSTKFLQHKYLDDKQPSPNYHQQQRNKKSEQLTIIQKIDDIKRDLHNKPALTQTFVNDDTFQQVNTQQIYLNHKFENEEQQGKKLSINKKSNQEKQSKKLKPNNENMTKTNNQNKTNGKVGGSNKANDKVTVNKPNEKPGVNKKKNALINKFNKHNWNEVVNKLIQVLDEQIKIDKQLLEYRQMFSNLPLLINSPKSNQTSPQTNTNLDKWDVLLQKIQETPSLLKNYQHQQLKKLISVNAGEGNPFWQQPNHPKPNHQIIINILIQFLCKSQSHWNQNIVGFITKNQMEESCFSITILDLNKLGYISVQDLVCFINLHTKNLYRNRDLLTIFKRFCIANNLDYQDNKITYQEVENVIVIGNQYSSFNK